MNKGSALGGVLLGAIIGAGGYHVASRQGVAGRPAAAARTPVPAPSRPARPAIQAELSELRKMVADAQLRLSRLEARPGLEEALDDPAMRDRLAAVVTDARNATMAPPRPAPVVPESWREGAINRYRHDYGRILDDLRRQLQLDDAAWKEAKPILDRHFEPVEAALREVPSGRGNAMPRVHELVAPGLQATLEALRMSLSPEAWMAFESWRKSEDAAPTWGSVTRGECFLDGEDHRNYRQRRTVQMHWATLQDSLPGLRERLDLDARKREQLDGVLKAHVARVCAAFQDERGEGRIVLMTESGRARVRAATEETEAELARLLGADGMRKFRDWKATAGNLGAAYFGETVKPVPPGAVPAAAAAPSPGSAQRAGAPGVGPERF
jgi:hypothetical protein